MLEKTKAFCDSLLEVGLPGFDIAVYETRSAIDTNKILKELEQICLNPAMMNFKRVVEYALANLDDSHMEVLRSNSGYLERITKGNYLDFKLDGLDLEAAERVISFHESNERDKKRINDNENNK